MENSSKIGPYYIRDNKNKSIAKKFYTFFIHWNQDKFIWNAIVVQYHTLNEQELANPSIRYDLMGTVVFNILNFYSIHLRLKFQVFNNQKNSYYKGTNFINCFNQKLLISVVMVTNRL